MHCYLMREAQRVDGTWVECNLCQLYQANAENKVAGSFIQICGYQLIGIIFFQLFAMHIFGM